MTQETRTISFKGVELEVEFDVYPGCRGAREHGTGLQLEPDEPPSVEVTEANLIVDYDNFGDKLARPICADLGELIDDKFKDIESQIMEERSNDEPDQGY